MHLDGGPDSAYSSVPDDGATLLMPLCTTMELTKPSHFLWSSKRYDVDRPPLVRQLEWLASASRGHQVRFAFTLFAIRGSNMSHSFLDGMVGKVASNEPAGTDYGVRPASRAFAAIEKLMSYRPISTTPAPTQTISGTCPPAPGAEARRAHSAAQKTLLRLELSSPRRPQARRRPAEPLQRSS